MSARHTRPALALLLSLGVALWAIPSVMAQENWLSRFAGQSAQTQPDIGTVIKVRGSGSVAVPPDQAVVTLGVERQAPQAAAALSANNDAVNQVVAALAKAGVPADAIRTGQFALSAEAPAATSTNAAAPRSYNVVNTVTLTTSQLDQVGTLIEAAVAAGANRVDGVQFGIANPARYRSQAMRAALAAAAADGRALAATLGAREPRVVSVSTVDQSPTSMVGGAVPLIPGQSTVDAVVELTLAIDNASLPVAPRATATASATMAPTVALSPTVSGTTVSGTTIAPGAKAVATAAASASATLQATPTLRVPATAGNGTPVAGGTAAAAIAPGAGLPYVAVTQAGNGMYRGTRSRAYVITSAADWERMVAPLLPAGVKINPDYAKETVIAVFLGERPGPGHAIKVRGIQAQDGVLRVAVDVTEPTGTAQSGARPSSPYQVVTIRNADLPTGARGLLQAEVAR